MHVERLRTQRSDSAGGKSKAGSATGDGAFGLQLDGTGTADATISADATGPAMSTASSASALATQAATATAAIGLSGGAPPPPSDETLDRAARAHGGAMLRALGGLQVAVLQGDGRAALATLSALAVHVPDAADPGLARIVRAIAQRAAIETARGG